MNGERKTGLKTIAISMVFGAVLFALPCSGAQDSARGRSRMQTQPLQMGTTQMRSPQPFSMRPQHLQMQQASNAQPRFQSVQVAPFTLANPNGVASGSSVRPGAGSGFVRPPQRIPFERPFVANNGTPFRTSPWTSIPAGPAPGGIPLPNNPTAGWGDGLKYLPNDRPWNPGLGKADWGDGLMGLPDGSDGPQIPNHGKDLPEAGIRPHVGPEQGGPDGGYYGNLDPKYNLSGAADGPNQSPENKSTDSHKSAEESMQQMGATETWVVRSGKENQTGIHVIGFVERGGEEYAILLNTDGRSSVVDGLSARVAFGLTPSKEFSHPIYEYHFGVQHVGHGKTTRPDGGDGKVDPREDPTLMLKLTKAADAQQKGESLRPDAVLSDPVPVASGNATSEPDAGSAAQDNDLAAAGAAKAESAWRYAGKKPGSEITDPAEWQAGKAPDMAVARIKHFEIIDPSECQALLGALASSQAAGGVDDRNQTLAVSSTTGSVQLLSCENGKAGWVPLDAGEGLTAGSIVRVENASGGRVNFAQPGASAAIKWSAISSNAKYTLYRVDAQP